MPGALRFLADLNISPLTVEALAGEGWDIRRTAPVLAPDAPDIEILTFARTEGFVVLTQDLDYSALLALSGLDRPSLVTLRLTDPAPARVTQRLREVASLLEKALCEPCAVTIGDETVRLRRLPIS